MATIESCIATAEWQKTMQEEIQQLHVFGDVPADEIACLVAAGTEQLLPEGMQVVGERDHFDAFMILLEGRMRVSRQDAHGQYFFNKMVNAPGFMGEVPLLTNMPVQMKLFTESPIRSIRLEKSAFWDMMARCPSIRDVIISEMAHRVTGMKKRKRSRRK